ncbi:MAG TPA: PAS domain S-box protein [bacterium]|nr:PAS domain S-box protein [bacterium]
MNNLFLNSILDDKETIVIAWSQQIRNQYQREMTPERVDALFDFLCKIIKAESEPNLIKQMKQIFSDFYLSVGIQYQSFREELITGKKLISARWNEADMVEKNEVKARFAFYDRFDNIVTEIFNQYSQTYLSKLNQKREIFEEATDFLRSAINFSKIGLFILDSKLNIIYWGKGVERLYGIKESEVLNRPILQLFPSLEQEDIYQKMADTVQSGRSCEFVSEILNSVKKGRRVIDFNFSPLKDRSGEIIGVNVLLHDVTDHMQADDSLKEYQRFISNIFEDAAEAIFVLDENDCIKMWNKHAAHMYGYSADEMIGKHISAIVPDDEKSQQEIRNINEIIKKKGFVRDWETERITIDGRKLLLRITRTAIRDENGNYLGSSVIAHDITEKRRLEQQLIQSEKLSAVGQLAAGIAHEVGSPLTAISSLAQLLYERSRDEWDRDKLKMIREQIERISRIVRELVNFSKPISTSVGEVSVNKVIEEAAQIVKYDKRLKHFKFQQDLFPQLPMIKISFDQMLQVLINILLNAGDAMEGRSDGEISISTRLVGEKIIISIIDNGIGIEKKSLDHIFEPFYTTKKPGKGTGLGLWVCYNIIKGFSGEILVESELNQGTAFHIVLPVLKISDEQDDE